MKRKEGTQLEAMAARMKLLRDDIVATSLDAPGPDRLGDALREIVAQGGVVDARPLQFAVRIGDQVAIFEVRHLRSTTRFVPHGHKAFRRVGGVLCIDPDTAFDPASSASNEGARQMVDHK